VLEFCEFELSVKLCVPGCCLAASCPKAGLDAVVARIAAAAKTIAATAFVGQQEACPLPVPVTGCGREEIEEVRCISCLLNVRDVWKVMALRRGLRSELCFVNRLIIEIVTGREDSRRQS